MAQRLPGLGEDETQPSGASESTRAPGPQAECAGGGVGWGGLQVGAALH